MVHKKSRKLSNWHGFLIILGSINLIVLINNAEALGRISPIEEVIIIIVCAIIIGSTLGILVIQQLRKEDILRSDILDDSDWVKEDKRLSEISHIIHTAKKEAKDLYKNKKNGQLIEYILKTLQDIESIIKYKP